MPSSALVETSCGKPYRNIIPSYPTGRPIALIGSNRLPNLHAKQPNNPVATFRQVQGTVRRGANALFGFYRYRNLRQWQCAMLRPSANSKAPISL